MINKIFGRKPGISLLVPTQNSEKTVELCIRSFAEFPDEMIVVDNGSTDKTKEIIRSLAREYENLFFFDAPKLKDLYENRQFAFSKSSYDWIVRIDSDYVAHTSGKNDIQKLRSKILNEKRGFIPKAFGITQVNLAENFEHTGIPIQGRKGKGTMHVPPPLNTLKARIIQWYPGMKFKRLGRWEGVRFQRYLRHIQLKEPFWFHCSFKEPKDHLFRFYRTDWREIGDFKKYPTLESYVVSQIYDKYGTRDLIEAANRHLERWILPFIVRYDEKKNGEYPDLIKKQIKY